MSMHEMEYFIECAVDTAAASGLSVGQKRDLIHTLFCLEENGDCGFTHGRTTRSMVESGYTFLFDKEDMHDYAERQAFYDEELPGKAAFSMGDLYIYDDYDKGFPEADGKLCVDSGSKAWEGMVAAGKITGEGAKPVRRLPTHEVLLMARRLLEAAYGNMDDYLKNGYLMTLFMSDACEGFTAHMPDDYFDLLLGCTREGFADIDFEEWALPEGRQPDGVPFRSYTLYGSPIDMIVDDALWPDGSYLFYGYKGEGTLSLWENNLPFEAYVVDESRAFRVNPYRVDDEPVAWLAKADDTLSAITALANDVAARGASLSNPNIDLPIKAYFDSARLGVELREQEEAITDPGLSYADKMQATAKTYIALAEIIEASRVPDELITEDSAFTALLILLHSQAARLVDYAGEPGAPHPNQLRQAGERLLEAAGTELDRHMAHIRAGKVGLTAEKQAEIAALIAEVSQEGAVLERWVEVVNNLWQNPLVDLKERLTYAGAMIQFLGEARDYVASVAGEFRASVLPVPDMASDIKAMEDQMILLSAMPSAHIANAAADYASTLGWAAGTAPSPERAIVRARTDADRRYSADTTLFYRSEAWPGSVAVNVRDGQIQGTQEAE